jgi:hypothetical protein
MVAVNSDEEMSKRKVPHESAAEFPGPRIQSKKMKDPMTTTRTLG